MIWSWRLIPVSLAVLIPVVFPLGCPLGLFPLIPIVGCPWCPVSLSLLVLVVLSIVPVVVSIGDWLSLVGSLSFLTLRSWRFLDR